LRIAAGLACCTLTSLFLTDWRPRPVNAVPPLYDPRFEHDACGVGFIAARDGSASHRLTRLAVECLRRLDHRGAKAADGTGDGAGIMTQVPLRLLERDLAAITYRLPAGRRLGVVMAFLPPGEEQAHRDLVEEAVGAEGARVVHWRTVPIDTSVLSARALESLPVIEQAVVESPAGADDDAFERLLFLSRKRLERAETSHDFSIASASGRTVV